jgi:hypothetical protein
MSGLVSVRAKSILNQMLVVGATLLLGSAIHVGFVAGTAEPTSPAVVLRAVAGGLLGIAGYATRVSREERLGTEGGESEAGADGDATAGEEFDPEVSPLDRSDMEGLDRDDG